MIISTVPEGSSFFGFTLELEKTPFQPQIF
jgi:hypothetical protein